MIVSMCDKARFLFCVHVAESATQTSRVRELDGLGAPVAETVCLMHETAFVVAVKGVHGIAIKNALSSIHMSTRAFKKIHV